MTKTWCPFPTSRILDVAEIEVPTNYVLASGNSRLGTPDFVALLLDLPVLVLLLTALLLLAGFYTWLLSFERELTAFRERE
jgi:hypothetical protein